MKEITYKDIVTPELLEGTLDHNVHTGFLEDYRIISCLLRIYKPKTIFELGTNVGGGINVMARALPKATIYSLDLDYATMVQNSKQYPIGPNGEDRVGSNARVPYIQLRGDSLRFDYSKYPCEAYFVDGEHDYEHPYHETKAILRENPDLIIYHDADIAEVYQAILDGFTDSPNAVQEYDLVRVTDTRILYAKKK